MNWQDAILVVELVVLLLIYKDDHEMLKVSRESLAAQKQYLDLRRKWYEARTRKKDAQTVAKQEATTGLAASDNSDGVQRSGSSD